MGIATGLVVVGDLIGSGEAQERGIVAGTPNVAARLQGLVEPNSVVIAERTRRLLGILFELKDLGPQELKGIPGSIRDWAALLPSWVEGRFEALHAGGLIELIGRQEELELLLRRWSGAKTGEGESCFSQATVSQSRGSRQHFWKASPMKRTPVCAISARLSTPIARFIGSSARWNVLLD